MEKGGHTRKKNRIQFRKYPKNQENQKKVEKQGHSKKKTSHTPFRNHQKSRKLKEKPEKEKEIKHSL